ncbi:ATP-dependent DNA helicase RecG [Helicobacter sp. 12S02634-8]|uniref:ATP-dependent DNA helicase RecG n=1 Tax=Helicobacter sp. 12S02634-8 TaxID=1476199 RepID=UPI000BA6A9F8|nr:ATP-dependent DNA helicase RecG [Helicobacter sp. 12S02634-8]PAF47821.1 ATP-dependent DNA helicase RecG [Helicobacter sp. 12S02634-8]
MKISDSDYIKLQKLGCQNLLAFALHIPKSYTDTTLLDTLEPSSQGAVAIEVERAEWILGKNILKVQAHMPQFHQPLELVIFNAKSFHKAIYVVGKSLYVWGKIEYKFGKYSMNQPKPLSTQGEIIAHFKSTAMRSIHIFALAKKLLTRSNLIEEGLPCEIAQLIAEIFCPTKAFMEVYQQANALPATHLNALKWTEIYAHLKYLAQKRRYFTSKYICTNDYRPFVDSLPFMLTSAQSETIQTIANDLKSPTAAKRLVMGDVGCGKTIVILSAVVMAYPHKSLLMAPTTILAQQLYAEAKKFLPDYITCKLITGSAESTRSKKSKDKGLFQQEEHFIIGTQALLYRELDGENLALVMTDEQHRFGTRQRHYLEKLTEDKTTQDTKKPHVLQFSATPIPRTMAMLNASLIDFSSIKDLPFKKDITTTIIHKENFPQLISHIRDEIAHNKQVVIVYPLVEESQHLEYLSLKEGGGFWQKHFDRVYITSGKDKDKEKILEEFREKGNILLATTLIEVGISLPKLSTIVIVAPERLGLATLHQLRGRVSRNGLKGYCFLYTHQEDSERLREFCEHLSGFDIAELDLKYRSSGDLLYGDRQSGVAFEFFDITTDTSILLEVKNYLSSQPSQHTNT